MKKRSDVKVDGKMEKRLYHVRFTDERSAYPYRHDFYTLDELDALRRFLNRQHKEGK